MFQAGERSLLRHIRLHRDIIDIIIIIVVAPRLVDIDPTARPHRRCGSCPAASLLFCQRASRIDGGGICDIIAASSFAFSLSPFSLRLGCLLLSSNSAAFQPALLCPPCLGPFPAPTHSTPCPKGPIGITHISFSLFPLTSPASWTRMPPQALSSFPFFFSIWHLAASLLPFHRHRASSTV